MPVSKPDWTRPTGQTVQYGEGQSRGVVEPINKSGRTAQRGRPERP